MLFIDRETRVKAIGTSCSRGYTSWGVAVVIAMGAAGSISVSVARGSDCSDLDLLDMTSSDRRR